MAARQQPRDFYAEARSLLRGANAGCLATSEDGQPHAALVTVAFGAGMQPILLLSELSAHTRQLNANPACALLLVGEERGPNPQTTPRLSLSGTAGKTQAAEARSIFLAAHPYANLYVDFADFAFWQVFVTEATYIGGFGAARQLGVAELAGPPVP